MQFISRVPSLVQRAFQDYQKWCSVFRQGAASRAGKEGLIFIGSSCSADLKDDVLRTPAAGQGGRGRSRGKQLLCEMSSEEAVGILCYANSYPGFRGILKQRYSDFIVNEVDLGGNVIHLTNIEAPSEERVELVRVAEETVADAKEEKEMHKNDDFSADVLAFKEIAGESNAKVLEDLVGRITICTGEQVPPVLLAPDEDKNHRGIIHNFFKTRLTFLTTDTVDGPTAREKCIRLRHQVGSQGGGGRRGKRFQKRGRDQSGQGSDSKRQKTNEDLDQPYDARGSDGWPSERPKFLQFHLYKENKDTQDALSVISRMLYIQPKSFGFAGTKDKRAITTQQVTVFKQTAAKLAALNKRLFGIRVGDFRYVERALVLGMLSGNRFNVTLRGVVAEGDQTFKNAVEGLGHSGFINYFGLQRFGSGSIPTHRVGAALLRGEWRAAVNLILDPREGDQLEVTAAREYYKETGNADGALQRFPRYLTAERALLTSLKRDASNYLQAINSIPRTLRLMYVHSYQSYLWNHAASHRAKSRGVDKVFEGDLVYEAKGDSENVEELESSENHLSYYSLSNSGIGVTEVLLDDVMDADVTADGRNKVKCLTAKDIATGRYHVSDVLLPLPGGTTLYPASDTADVYHELASKDAVDLHSCTHNVKEYAINLLPGGYRRFLQKPVNLQWKMFKYSDPTKPLAETDLDRLLLSAPHSNSAGGLDSKLGTMSERKKVNAVISEDVEFSGKKVDEFGDTEVNCTEKALKDPIDSKINANDISAALEEELPLQTAAQLSFTLPASCYATMAIRELLKMSTSVAFHKILNAEPASAVVAEST